MLSYACTYASFGNLISVFYLHSYTGRLLARDQPQCYTRGHLVVQGWFSSRVVYCRRHRHRPFCESNSSKTGKCDPFDMPDVPSSARPPEALLPRNARGGIFQSFFPRPALLSFIFHTAPRLHDGFQYATSYHRPSQAPWSREIPSCCRSPQRIFLQTSCPACVAPSPRRIQ